MSIIVTAAARISTDYQQTGSWPSSTPVENFTDTYTLGTFGSGTADYLADKSWSWENLALTTSDTWDLSALVGIFETINMVKVRKLYIRNLSATIALTVGSASTHPWIGMWSGTVVIPPLGVLLVIAPIGASYPVVSGTSSQIKIAPASGTGAYLIEVTGTHV